MTFDIHVAILKVALTWGMRNNEPIDNLADEDYEY